MRPGKETFLTWRGVTNSLAEWSEITGASVSAIRGRLRRGHTMEEALWMNAAREKPLQLCWSCQKACGKCSWSRKVNPKPVQGWIAFPTRVFCSKGRYTDSYDIRFCPEYVKDKPQRWNDEE